MASADKTGSTAIFADLTAHPQISNAGACKEVCFHGGKGDPRDSRPLEEYAAMFPSTADCPEVVTTEACPDYFLQSQHVALKLHLRLPNVRVVIFARDPVQRFLSRLVGNYEHQTHSETCAQLLHDSPFDFAHAVPPQLADERVLAALPSPVAGGAYAAVIEAAWLPVFGHERLLLLPTEWLASDTTMTTTRDEEEDLSVAALQLVARFLRLEPWSRRALDARATVRQRANDAAASSIDQSSHTSHLREALADNTSRWARLYKRKSNSDTWMCSDHHLTQLLDLYEPLNRRHRHQIEQNLQLHANDAAFNTTTRLLQAWPAWLDAKATRPEYDRGQSPHDPAHRDPRRLDFYRRLQTSLFQDARRRRP